MPFTRTHWTDEQTRAIKSDYPWRDIDELASELGKTKSAIGGRARKLGVQRYPLFIRNMIANKTDDVEE